MKTTGCHLILHIVCQQNPLIIGAAVIPKYDARFAQLECKFIVLHCPGLASYFIPVDLRAEFGVLILKTDFRASMHKRLRRSDQVPKAPVSGNIYSIAWLDICNRQGKMLSRDGFLIFDLKGTYSLVSQHSQKDKLRMMAVRGQLY